MNQMGELSGYPGKIWYNPKGIANILSLANVSRHFCVHFNSANEQAFLIKKPDGSTKCFVLLKAGLYYHDTATKDVPPMYDGNYGTMLVNTVNDKKSQYTACLYSQALLARKIQNMIGYPSTCNYLQIIDGLTSWLLRTFLAPMCTLSRARPFGKPKLMSPYLNAHSP